MSKTKTKTKSQLPDKPSELIFLALDDLKKSERSKKYSVNMDVWHGPYNPEDSMYADEKDFESGKCSVCFAGSIMAHSLDGDINKNYELDSFPAESNKLDSLDYFRKGNIQHAFECFYEEDVTVLNPEYFERDIVRYADDPALFKKEMRKLATDLAKHGA